MIKGELSKQALYAGMAGLVLSDIIPTPGDALYFYYVRKIRNKLESGEITSKEYWTKEALAYYTFNSVWWLIVFVIVASYKGDAGSKLKLLFSLLGAGIVITVLSGNIKKDRLKFEK